MSWGQVLSNLFYEDNFLVHRAVREMNGLYAASQFLIPKARKKYRLSKNPIFLPTPVSVPDQIRKDTKPTVCFNARWDRRKRPELFFELAKEFPRVQFIAIGKSRDAAWDTYLRNKYNRLPNLEMVGFINQFEDDKLSTTLEKSWVVVNTAAREGLPNSFIEAAAHGCAILSAVDPDRFASNFGYHAQHDDFAKGLEILLDKGNWRKRGNLGREYILNHFAIDKSIDEHLDIYQKTIAGT